MWCEISHQNPKNLYWKVWYSPPPSIFFSLTLALYEVALPAFKRSCCFHLRPSSCFGLPHMLCHLLFNASPPTLRPHHSLEGLSPNKPHSWKKSCISFPFPWNDCCCFIIISLLLYLTYNRCKKKILLNPGVSLYF